MTICDAVPAPPPPRQSIGILGNLETPVPRVEMHPESDLRAPASRRFPLSFAGVPAAVRVMGVTLAGRCRLSVRQAVILKQLCRLPSQQVRAYVHLPCGQRMQHQAISGWFLGRTFVQGPQKQ